MRNLINRMFRRENLKFAVIAAIVLILGAGYLWYANNYGNKKQVMLETETGLQYEWADYASQYNLTADYIWARTESVMIKSELSGHKFIPEYYMIQGQLTEETSEYSERFLLTDQAHLLTLYVRQNNRIAAIGLKDAVIKEFAGTGDSVLLVSAITNSGSTEETISIYDNMVWLESFLEYYSVFGSKGDYELLQEEINALFDEEGNIRFSELSYATLIGKEVTDEEGESVIDTELSENDSSHFKFRGVELRSVKLRLIKNLENSNLLPAGAYDKALSLIKNGLVSAELGLYAYGYGEKYDDSKDNQSYGAIGYIYEGAVPGSIDVAASIETAANLEEVGELNPQVYALLKQEILNQKSIGDCYNLVTGQFSGGVALDSYIRCMRISIESDDEDFYNTLCEIVGAKVATYTDSPVLSMLFRNRGYRYVCYANDNIEMYLLLT